MFELITDYKHDIYFVGAEFETKKSGKIVILGRVKDDKRFAYARFLVQFQDEYGLKRIATRNEIRSGLVNINNPYHKFIYNIGYIGIGKYHNSHPSYEVWTNILGRCYNENHRLYMKSNFIKEEFHCFQNFAKYYDEEISNSIIDMVGHNQKYVKVGVFV